MYSADDIAFFNFFLRAEYPRHPNCCTTVKMRALTEQETQTLFTKLAEYTGSSLKNLIAPLDNSPNADRYVFRLSHNRCYYVRLSLANLATSIPRDNLLSLGICMGMYIQPNLAMRFSNLRRKIHQNWQIPSAHNRPPHHRRTRPQQDLDSPERCHALPLRLERRQGSHRQVPRRRSRTLRRNCLHAR